MGYLEIALLVTCTIACTFVGNSHGSGTCPQFSLSYPPNGTYLCPGSNITYTCVLSSSSPGAVITIWKGSAFVCPSYTNQISLFQKSGGVLYPTTSGTCGSLSAVTTNISTDGTCYTSVLTIPAVQALNGTTVMCSDGVGLAVVGNDTLMLTIITLPGMPSNVQSSMVCTNSLVLQWTPATSGNNATSYTISLNNTTTLVTNSTNITIGGLIDGSNYTVSVTATNCAGSSNSSSVSVQTLPCAPVNVSVTTILYQNNSVYGVELFWTHRQSCSVPLYTVMVSSGASYDMSAVNPNYCNSSSCSYIQSVSGKIVSSYNVSVACRNTLNQTGQPYVTMQSVPTPVLQVGQLNVSGNSATINCTLLDGSSHYCVVCCSSDPSVPAGSVGYLSSTSGPSVSVSLQSLGSNQMYYCKAAATNTNSASCGGPVVGGVKVFFSFMTNYTLSPPSPSSPLRSVTASPVSTLLSKPNSASLTGGQIAGIVVGVVVGTLILLALVVLLVVVIVIFVCIKPRKYSPTSMQLTDQGEMRDMLKKESSATPERALDGHEVYDTLMKREQTPVEATPTESTTFKEPVNTEPTKYADLQPLKAVNIEISSGGPAPTPTVQYSGIIV